MEVQESPDDDTTPHNSQQILPQPDNSQQILPQPDNSQQVLQQPDNSRQVLPQPPGPDVIELFSSSTQLSMKFKCSLISK